MINVKLFAIGGLFGCASMVHHTCKLLALFSFRVIVPRFRASLYSAWFFKSTKQHHLGTDLRDSSGEKLYRNAFQMHALGMANLGLLQHTKGFVR